MSLRPGRKLTSSLAAQSLFALACLAAPARTYSQALGGNDGPLPPPSDVSRAHLINNDAIIRMSKAGLGDDLILQTISLQPGRYDTSPDDLIALKNAGVSPVVISAMQAYGTGLHVRTVQPAQPSPAPTVGPPVPLASGIDEIGVYYKDPSGGWLPLQTERVEFKSGGWLKSTATHNIVKQDLNGHIDGRQSTLVLKTGTHFLIYAPAGTQPEEYDLIRFREHSNAREFRVKTGGVFHNQTGSQRDEIEFKPQRLARQIYEFAIPTDIEKGEYGVLPPGSSNVPGISNAGKMFTFSVRE